MNALGHTPRPFLSVKTCCVSSKVSPTFSKSFACPIFLRQPRPLVSSGIFSITLAVEDASEIIRSIGTSIILAIMRYINRRFTYLLT